MFKRKITCNIYKQVHIILTHESEEQTNRLGTFRSELVYPLCFVDYDCTTSHIYKYSLIAIKHCAVLNETNPSY